MRRKKHKHTRKTVAFYKVHYGFKEPFKVEVLRSMLCLAVGARGPLLPCTTKSAPLAAAAAARRRRNALAALSPQSPTGPARRQLYPRDAAIQVR